MKECILCGAHFGSPAMIDEFLMVAPDGDVLCDDCMANAFSRGLLIEGSKALDDWEYGQLRMRLIEARLILSESGISSVYA